jgi:hypothetical protein
MFFIREAKAVLAIPIIITIIEGEKREREYKEADLILCPQIQRRMI